MSQQRSHSLILPRAHLSDYSYLVARILLYCTHIRTNKQQYIMEWGSSSDLTLNGRIPESCSQCRKNEIFCLHLMHFWHTYTPYPNTQKAKQANPDIYMAVKWFFQMSYPDDWRSHSWKSRISLELKSSQASFPTSPPLVINSHMK